MKAANSRLCSKRGTESGEPLMQSINSGRKIRTFAAARV
jgi:hypothetical protein